MAKKLLLTFKESAQAVLPVTVILLILNFAFVKMPVWTLIMFIAGSFLLILGMGIFSIGADTAMMPIGEAVGSTITKSKKLWLIIISGFILGAVVTIAEPDLQVLANQVNPKMSQIMVLSVAFGVGVYLVIALLRILFQISLPKIFIISYALIFLLAIFADNSYLGLAFDSSGVTTGPITVPFILAFGAGISAVRGDKSSEEDSFGLCALCSVGPIFAVLIMGLFIPSTAPEDSNALENINSLQSALSAYGESIKDNFFEVIQVLLPIVIIFIIFQITRLKLSKTVLFRILFGLIYTLVGITIFLTGINMGFSQAGSIIGKSLAENEASRSWLIPISAVIGFFVVFAEPAVHVLNKQVEDITSGAITRKMMMAGLSVGVSLSLVLSVLRILTQTSLWFFILPGFVIALGLTFFTPKIFVAIAFDSGGVAAGTMAAAFLLPFAKGISEGTGGDIMLDAFGIIAMVATLPIISIQILGIIYNIKLKHNKHIDEHMLIDGAEAIFGGASETLSADELELPDFDDWGKEQDANTDKENNS